MADLTCTLSADRTQIHLHQGEWRASIATTALPIWVDLYQRLHDRDAPAGSPAGTPGPYARFYVQPLAELRRVQRQLKDGANG